MRTVFIDQDNTLNDFIFSTVKYVGKLYEADVSAFTAEDCKSYNVLKNIFPYLEQSVIDGMWEELFSEENFWLDMPIRPNAADVMKELCKKHDVYIVTAPWPTSDNCIPEKLEWIDMHLPFFDHRKVIFINNKKLLHGDIIIDDSPTYLTQNGCPFTVAYDYPYNRDVKSSYRVRNWLDIKKMFDSEEYNTELLALTT